MTQIAKPEQTTGNESGANPEADAKLTRGRSGPVRFELIDKGGKRIRAFPSAERAAYWANCLWPDQLQDPDRTGAGWDVQVVGVE